MTVNAAHVRFGISREVLTKQWNGMPVGIVAAERVADALQLGLSRWRELNGHPPLPDETDPNRALETVREKAAELTWDPDLSDWDIRNYDGDRRGLAGLSEADIDYLNQLQRAALTELRKKQGRD